MTNHQKQSIWTHLFDKPTNEDRQYESQTHNAQPMSSRSEVWSWYMADFGTTPFFIVIVAMIFPVYLVILATQYGCQYNTPYGCDYNNNPINANQSVFVYIGSTKWNPESFATLMIALSGILQCIAYLFISSIADYSTYQHYMFRIFTLIGSFMIIFCVIFNDPKHYAILGIWGAFMLVPMGLAQILYNAYLPVLVENHWSIRRFQKDNSDIEQIGNTETVMLTQPTQHQSHDEIDNNMENKYKKTLQSTQDDMSQFGICIGYVGGLIATVISAVILFIFVDITSQITDSFGIDQSTEYISYIGYHEEYWMKKVIGVNIWYSYINITDKNEYFMHGIQFMYENINGSIYGITTEDTDFILKSYFAVDNNDYINEVILFYSNNTNIIHSISMITYNKNIFKIGNVSDKLLSKIITSDNYPMDLLSGYSTHFGIYNSSEIASINTIPIITSFSFAFMDSVKGQYGNNYDNLIVFAFVGFWCVIFSIPSFCTLKKRIKPSLPKTECILSVSVKSYWNTFKTAKSYPHLFRTLIAWFIWSDASNTIGTIGILFAQNELNMNGLQLILLLLEIQLLASIGNVFFVWLQLHRNLTSKNLLIIHLCINCMLPIWAMFGLIKYTPIGLVNIIELYVIVGLFYASQLGSLFSASRSLYAHLIPIGNESKYFGLYELTNKGSSWIGPLISAFIANAYSLRYALIYVLIFYLIAIPILQFGVDYNEGLKQAGKLDLDNVGGGDNNVDHIEVNVVEMQEVYNDQK